MEASLLPASIKRILLLIAGVLALLLGIIGVFLPLLPTVPLVLLAAFCFARSSKRLHQWLLQHRYFGPMIENFQGGKGIPKRVKYRTIVIIWLSMGFSCWIVAKLWLCMMLIVIGLGVSVYLWRLPDYRCPVRD